MPSLLNGIVSIYVSRVRASAAPAGGACSWAFSQALSPVSDIIGTFAATRNGICELLSAKWIECHAHGSSLAAWLGNPIDPSKIRMMMQFFAIGATMNPLHMVEWEGANVARSEQTMATRLYLAARGVQMMAGGQRAGEGVVSKKQARGTGMRRVLAHNLALGIVSSQHPYVTIGAWGPGGAHAMAAYVGGAGVTFFDPNFGDFTFATKAQFVDWFGTFWHRSFYGNPFQGLGDSTEICEYAPGAI